MTKHRKNAEGAQPAVVRTLNSIGDTVKEKYDAEGVLKKRSEKYASKLLSKESKYLGMMQTFLYGYMLYLALIWDTLVKTGQYIYDLNKEYGPVVVKKIKQGVQGFTTGASAATETKRKSSLSKLLPGKKKHE